MDDFKKFVWDFFTRDACENGTPFLPPLNHDDLNELVFLLDRFADSGGLNSEVFEIEGDSLTVPERIHSSAEDVSVNARTRSESLAESISSRYVHTFSLLQGKEEHPEYMDLTLEGEGTVNTREMESVPVSPATELPELHPHSRLQELSRRAPTKDAYTEGEKNGDVAVNDKDGYHPLLSPPPVRRSARRLMLPAKYKDFVGLPRLLRNHQRSASAISNLGFG